MDSAIYAIVCLANGRRYVGSALSFKVRKRIHLSDLGLNRHHSRHLQRAWNKYGPEAFKFDILEHVTDPSLLVGREQHHIDRLTPEFNGCPKAGSNLGYKHSPESLEKMRAWKRDRPGPMKGRTQTPEARALMSAAKKGHKLKLGTRHSEESKRKMSQTRLRMTQHNSRPVEQLTSDGTPIRRFRSMADAARHTGAHPGAIRHVLAGRARLAAGYGWRDADGTARPFDADLTTRADFPWEDRPVNRKGIMLPFLRAIREAKPLSQRELSEQTGVRVPKISSYELGRTGASPRTILRLARVLGVSPRVLLDPSTVPPNSAIVPHLGPPPEYLRSAHQSSEDRARRIATNVARLRGELGFDLSDLAARAAVATRTLADLEGGLRKTYPSTLRKVAGALGCTVDDLAAATAD